MSTVARCLNRLQDFSYRVRKGLLTPSLAWRYVGLWKRDGVLCWD